MARSSRDIQDELLVLDAQSGDARAMEELARRWTNPLLGVARRRTGSDDGAWEVVQESWVAIVRGIRRLRDPSLFGPWSRRIIAYKSADWIRARRNGRIEATLATEPPADTEDQDGNVWALRRAMRALPAERRELLVLHYREGLGLHVIAELLEVPIGTVKSRLHATREELRQIIERSEQ